MSCEKKSKLNGRHCCGVTFFLRQKSIDLGRDSIDDVDAFFFVRTNSEKKRSNNGKIQLQDKSKSNPIAQFQKIRFQIVKRVGKVIPRLESTPT